MAIYIYKNNQQTGPFEEGKVVDWLKEGKLSAEDLGCRTGSDEWQALKVLFPQAVPIAAQNISPPGIVENISGAEKMPAVTKKRSGKKFLTGCGIALIIGLLLSAGLGFWLYRNLFPSIDKADLPDTVGKFNLGKSFPVKGNFLGTMTSYGAEYETEAAGRKTGLTYFLKNYSSESGAVSEADANNCERADLAKSGLLKDKTGKEVGAFKYCGGTLHFRNKTRFVTIYKFVLTKAKLAEANDDEIISFVKNLPFNSDLDMSGFASAYPSVKNDDKSKNSDSNSDADSALPEGVLSVSQFNKDYGKGADRSLEVSVKGYILSAPSAPSDSGSSGLTFLYEKEGDYSTKISCWFESENAPPFVKLKGMQYITIKGTLEANGSSDLRNCKLVSAE